MKKKIIILSFSFLILFGIFFNFLILYSLIFLIFALKLYSKFSYLKIIGTCIFFTFILFEIFNKQNEENNEYKIQSNIEYEINKDYGYHPKKNKIFSDKIFFKNELIKENFYTINEYGHRNIKNKNSNSKCIVLHGGSITFGQTLDDNENLPFLLKSVLDDDFNVFNYAFNGYGAHQFLSKIENEYIDEIKNCKKLFILYQFIPDHIGRSAGKRSWGDKSPRYYIMDNNLISSGFFSNFPYKIVMKLRKNFRSSKVLNIFYKVDSINSKDIQIFLKILLEIEKKVKQKFYDSEFVYILWDDMKNKDNNLNNFFSTRKKINIKDLNIKEEYIKNSIVGDNHPTKEFNVILANNIKTIFENKK